jgi:pyruvate/2-oxoglutarate dehydrogenase complex dihydrolipoamide dehydrogenase (E3) component
MKKLSAKKFDFIVIGGGSAGYTAAAEAVKHGLCTALVEDARELGGLCILRGCMPSKTLIASANRFQAVIGAREFGVEVKTRPRFHPRSVVARKRRLVEIFAKARREEIASAGFTLIRGRACFLDEHTLNVSASSGGPARPFTAKAFLVATGSYIPEPEFPGLAEMGYLTSDDILEDQAPPASVIVLGDGPVGLEAAHYYAAIGCQVTLVSKHGQILDSADRDVAKALSDAFIKAGVKIILRATVESSKAARGKKEIKVRIKGRAQSIRADEIIFAIGRKPCVNGLGLEAAGVTLTDDGHIEANEQQRTRRRNIFAAGDVCGPFEILHLAVQQGRIAARNAARLFGRLRGKDESMDYRMKLSGIFTEPQVAVLGLTEKKARERKIRVRVASYEFKEEGRAQVENETQGFAKLICEARSGKLLGAAIVGPSAVELIHEMVAVLHFGGTVETIAALPHYHPTLSEIWTFPAEKLSGLGS